MFYNYFGLKKYLFHNTLQLALRCSLLNVNEEGKISSASSSRTFHWLREYNCVLHNVYHRWDEVASVFTNA